MNVNKICLLKLPCQFTGLCNQIKSIVASICLCINEDKRILIIDKFLMQINTNQYCPIKFIINIHLLNQFLEKYNLKIVDGFEIHDKIEKTGVKILHTDNKLWNVLNHEKNKDIQMLLFKNICFSQNLVVPSLSYLSNLLNKTNSTKFNVIHLRLEQDAIDHWSKLTNLSKDKYKNHLINQYKKLINKYIDKNVLTIILSSNTNNEITQYLSTNNYRYTFIKKQFTNQREVNAARDAIIGKKCNDVFIGCLCSTFTDFLLNRIENATTKVCFDLTDIENYNEKIYYE